MGLLDQIGRSRESRENTKKSHMSVIIRASREAFFRQRLTTTVAKLKKSLLSPDLCSVKPTRLRS